MQTCQDDLKRRPGEVQPRIPVSASRERATCLAGKRSKTATHRSGNLHQPPDGYSGERNRARMSIVSAHSFAAVSTRLRPARVSR